jgi:hypothetical protein
VFGIASHQDVTIPYDVSILSPIILGSRGPTLIYSSQTSSGAVIRPELSSNPNPELSVSSFQALHFFKRWVYLFFICLTSAGGHMAAISTSALVHARGLKPFWPRRPASDDAMRLFRSVSSACGDHSYAALLAARAVGWGANEVEGAS